MKFLSTIIILIFFPTAILAANVEIVKVQTEGVGGSYDECVKIKNNGNEIFSLSGLLLQSRASSETAKWQSRSGDGLPDGLNINVGETIVLGSYNYTGTDAIWNHTARWGLSTDGGGIRLVEKDNDGNIINIFAEKYWNASENQTPEPDPMPEPQQPTGPAPTPENPPQQSINEPTEQQSTDEATIKKLDDIISPAPAHAENIAEEIDIQISEFMPNPTGSDDGEWIEIKNLLDKNSNISGWFIDDEDGGSKPYQFPENTIIPARGFLVLYKIQTKLALNNDVDSVRILKPNNEVQEKINYAEGAEGASYARSENGWFWTTTPTPASENLIKTIELEQPKKISSINTTAKTTASTNATIEGIVSVEPGILGSQIFYINTPNSNDHAGIQVYMYSKNFPELNIGDNIKIFGTFSESGGEKRIKVSAQKDILIISNGDEPEPYEINGKDIGENLEGSLVKISGEIVETKSTEFYIACADGGEVKVYFKESSGLSGENYKAGNNVEIVGIVSQTATGYRLLPRFEEDIIIKDKIFAEKENAGVAKNPNTKYYIILGAGLCSAMAMEGWKKKEFLKIKYNKIFNKSNNKDTL